MGIAKATLRNLATSASIEVPFNPEAYSLTSANSFDTKPGTRGLPTVTFTGTKVRLLTMSLFLDTSQSQADVRSQVQPILALLDKHASTGAPPSLLFTWGSFQFRCVLESVSQRYTRFLSNGSPVRAELELALLEGERAVPAPAASVTPAPQTVVPVSEGENLSQIASRTTGDPANWKTLARENNIDNPRKLRRQIALRISGVTFRWK